MLYSSRPRCAPAQRSGRQQFRPRLEILEDRLAPATFTVLNTNNSGLDSLRQAILDANALVGADVIAFNIGGGGVQTIAPTLILPQITDAVTIDGTTQPGYAGTPLIELSGNSGVLRIAANNCLVRGLAINGFSNTGITITGNGNVVQGNYIGTNVAGTAALGHGNTGVLIRNASGNRVEGNVISGTGIPGSVQGSPGAAVALLQTTGIVQDNTIVGNKIGTSADGTALIPNLNGVFIGGGAQGNVVEANLISGNTWYGVTIAGDVGIPQTLVTSGNLVRGNTITGNYNGVEVGAGPGFVFEASGYTVPTLGTKNNTVQDNIISGNRNYGVVIDGIRADSNVVYANTIQNNSSYGVAITGGAQGNTIGGAGALANTISGNTGGGVLVRNLGTDFFPGFDFFIANHPDSPTGNNIVPVINNAIRGNAIHANGGLGLDLNGDGVTANDSGDADAGPNQGQNFPVLAAAVCGAFTRVTGTVNSVAGATLTLDFYASATADPSGHGEGQRYLGSTTVIVDASGNAVFDVVLTAATATGEVVSATATDAAGSTSEFSAVALVTNPAASAALVADTCDPTKLALMVSGTNLNDTIFIDTAGSGWLGEVVVTVNGVVLGTFLPTGRIVIHGLAGDDYIHVAGSVGHSAWLYGDDGQDDLHGGGGDDVVLGGAGADEVHGGQGRDLLIGGLGADHVIGNADGDLLIAGTTAFDAHEEALCAIMSEWTSPRDYATRIANLRGTGNGPRANGAIFLKAEGPGVTVFDDGEVDLLVGTAGQDWFFANIAGGVLDDLGGIQGSEFIDDIN